MSLAESSQSALEISSRTLLFEGEAFAATRLFIGGALPAVERPRSHGSDDARIGDAGHRNLSVSCDSRARAAFRLVRSQVSRSQRVP